MLKKLLQDALLRGYAEKVDGPIYLQFSAGCDSMALFFSMMELSLKYHFRCITYIYKQPKSFITKIKGITKMFDVSLQIIYLSEEDVLANIKELQRRGFEGKVLLDCLAGHLPMAKQLYNCIIVNGSYADVLYGSYFYLFKNDMTQVQFNTKRKELLNTYDQDGVDSLRKLLLRNNNLLLTPFKDESVVKYFMDKTLIQCGRDKKTLFRKEFAEELEKLPFKIYRKAQQIESGIRNFRKQHKDKEYPTMFF